MTHPLPPAPAMGTPLEQPPAPEVLRFLARRRSSSALTLAEPGPTPDEVAQLLRLAMRIPDHGKLAPWRFIVLDREAKTAFAARLEALAEGRGDGRSAAKLAKLKLPPFGVAVVFHPCAGQIPEWEQQLSVGALCTTLLYAAQAMGFGANWITDWYAYDDEALAILGLAPEERLAGFVFMGTIKDPPLERERPDPGTRITRWGA